MVLETMRQAFYQQ